MKAGLQPYKYDLRLEKAAMVRAKEIAVKFSHIRPDGRNSSTAASEAGVGCPSGENIGMGTSSAPEIFPTPNRNGYKFDGWATEYGEKYHYMTAARNEKFTATWISDN